MPACVVLTYLVERLLEAEWIWCNARGQRLVVFPRWFRGVNLSGIDAAEKVEEVAWIGRIWALAPERENDGAKIVVIGCEGLACMAPGASAAIALGALRAWPDVGAAGHLIVGAWLLPVIKSARSGSFSRLRRWLRANAERLRGVSS